MKVCMQKSIKETLQEKVCANIVSQETHSPSQVKAKHVKKMMWLKHYNHVKKEGGNAFLFQSVVIMIVIKHCRPPLDLGRHHLRWKWRWSWEWVVVHDVHVYPMFRHFFFSLSRSRHLKIGFLSFSSSSTSMISFSQDPLNFFLPSQHHDDDDDSFRISFLL